MTSSCCENRAAIAGSHTEPSCEGSLPAAAPPALHLPRVPQQRGQALPCAAEAPGGEMCAADRRSHMRLPRPQQEASQEPFYLAYAWKQNVRRPRPCGAAMTSKFVRSLVRCTLRFMNPPPLLYLLVCPSTVVSCSTTQWQANGANGARAENCQAMCFCSC